MRLPSSCSTRLASGPNLLRLSRPYSSGRTVREFDVLFLRQQGARYPKWHLTAPLRRGAQVKLAYGASVAASDLIGREVLDAVQDTSGNKVVLHEPTLANHVLNSKRIATPIYPHDANTIVSLLDLNLPRPGEDEEGSPDAEPFEIFEAGTGLGSLTIHIARAIHAANPPLPASLQNALLNAPDELPAGKEATAPSLDLEPDSQSALDEYRSRRRVVLHTLDHKSSHSRNAFRVIRAFRRAMYLPTIDFHLGSVDGYITPRLEANDGKPFLSRAILDLPSAEENAGPVIEALRPNGLLVVFKPSISQIASFQAWCAETKQPVRAEKVIELPNTTVSEGLQEGTGGRQWEVKIVKPRRDDVKDTRMVDVMRPKVGDRMAGGGFLIVLRRWPSLPESIVEETPEETGVEDTSEYELNEVDADAADVKEKARL